MVPREKVPLPNNIKLFFTESQRI